MRITQGNAFEKGNPTARLGTHNTHFLFDLTHEGTFDKPLGGTNEEWQKFCLENLFVPYDAELTAKTVTQPTPADGWLVGLIGRRPEPLAAVAAETGGIALPGGPAGYPGGPHEPEGLTLIGPGTSIKGEITLSAPARILGEVEVVTGRTGHPVGDALLVHLAGNDDRINLPWPAYEAALKANCRRDSRHRVEHVEVIRAADIPRFAEFVDECMILGLSKRATAAVSAESRSTKMRPRRRTATRVPDAMPRLALVGQVLASRCW